MNTTNFISWWQFKIKCFFYLLCCSTNRKHTTKIYLKLQNKHNSPSRRKLRTLLATMPCRASVGREKREKGAMQSKKKFFAIYLIWSLDVALWTFEDLFGLWSYGTAIKWHYCIYAIPMNFHFSLKIVLLADEQRRTHRAREWVTHGCQKKSMLRIRRILLQFSAYKTQSSQQIRNKLHIFIDI